MSTQPSELGDAAAEGVGELLRRGTKGAPIATYAEGEPPISWQTISDGGWDVFGVLDDGEGASLRDLVELARAWGHGCVQQPLVTTLLAKRHSAAAAAHAGPVTIALPLPGGAAPYVPFGQVPGVVLATGLGRGSDELVPVPEGTPETLAISSRGIQADVHTELAAVVAREIAVTLAAAATGMAERLLADTLAFVKEREQFGKPIGSFQAVKHQLADAAIDAELAETAVIWGAERPDEAFRGALFAVDRCIDIAETAIQAQGGLGFTWEVGLHFPLRQMILTRDVVNALEVEHA
ncbi:acyl-CoA dehydrogenase family protein [Geodermatophilus africanus]|nr:acyl-CoA dehydrogenase family protein [Geodermatophilus africanus]